MKIENIESEKILLINLENYEEQPITIMDFIDQYHKAITKIKCKDYILIIDSTNLSFFEPATFLTLGKSYKLYMDSGFYKIFIINPKQITCKMQLHDIARVVGFTGIFIDNINECD